MSTQEIIKDMALWWMCISGGCLSLLICYFLVTFLDKINPENKFWKRILGEKLFNFLDRVL